MKWNRSFWLCCAVVSAAFLVVGSGLSAFPEPTPDSAGKRMFDSWVERQVRKIEAEGSLEPFATAEDWREQEKALRGELAEMLGLQPPPPRGDLKPVITGRHEVEGVRIENLHFQSVPGLYVTGNFYLPAAAVEEPLPAILYVCGHASVKENGVSFGNKTAYHHHGLWFARQGYACLIVDTLQLGEITGEHHGTHHLGKWWWVSRGYTSAGIEAWNGIRAVDYLVSRPEVDAGRLGVTGRSGGGATSWWVAALDERIAAAAPTAGITDLRNHLVDGCVEGHCDCMFQINTKRWDYDRVAGLVAPRALLVCNTDKDRIFPLDGVVRVYQKTRRLYELLGAGDKIGLHLAEGPHKDTQPLNFGAFHWFERHLKGRDLMDVLDRPAVKEVDAQVLRVFPDEWPADQLNTQIDQHFVPSAELPSGFESVDQWESQAAEWMSALRSQVFAGWPAEGEAPTVTEVGVQEVDGLRMQALDLVTDEPFELRLWLLHNAEVAAADLKLVTLNVLDETGWQAFAVGHGQTFAKLMPEGTADGAEGREVAAEDFRSVATMLKANPWAMAYVCPRGIGPSAWQGSDKAQTQRLRRFPLLGQTLGSTQVWDIRQALRALRGVQGFEKVPQWLQAEGEQGVNALFASLFEEQLARLDLHRLPESLGQSQLHYLNVLKYLDVPQALALRASKGRVILYDSPPSLAEAAKKLMTALDWADALQVR